MLSVFEKSLFCSPRLHLFDQNIFYVNIFKSHHEIKMYVTSLLVSN